MKTSVNALCEAIKDRQWRVRSNGCIRSGYTKLYGNCPLVACAFELAPKEYKAAGGMAGDEFYDTAAKAIGFTGDQMEFIAAADDTIEQIRDWGHWDTASSKQRAAITRTVRMRKKLFKLLDLDESRL